MFDLKQHPHRRFNALTGEWVLVSPHRTQRPWQGQVEKLPPENRPAYDPSCYLCPGNARAGGIRNPSYETTFVFENDFAALRPETPPGALSDESRPDTPRDARGEALRPGAPHGVGEALRLDAPHGVGEALGLSGRGAAHGEALRPDAPHGAGEASRAHAPRAGVGEASRLYAPHGVGEPLRVDAPWRAGGEQVKRDTRHGEVEETLRPEASRGAGGEQVRADAPWRAGGEQVKADTRHGEVGEAPRPEASRGAGGEQVRADAPWRAGGEQVKADTRHGEVGEAPGPEASRGPGGEQVRTDVLRGSEGEPLRSAAGGSGGPGALLRAEAEPGICRVVCFNPRHDLTLSRMSTEQIVPVIETWVEQHNNLAANPNIGFVQIFENRGEMMGASNPHPHCQIWSSMSLPNEAVKELQSQRAHRERTGRCLLCDYVAVEERSGERMVCANDSFIAVVPFWAVWPFELLLISRRHLADFPALTGVERRDLADLLRRVTTRYDNLFETPFPYTMGFHQRPVDGGEYPEWHFHAHYYPPLLRSATVRKFMVGYEMLGTPQRDITPESAALRLRELSETHYMDRE